MYIGSFRYVLYRLVKINSRDELVWSYSVVLFWANIGKIVNINLDVSLFIQDANVCLRIVDFGGLWSG